MFSDFFSDFIAPIAIIVVGSVFLYFVMRKAFRDAIAKEKENNNHKV